MADRQHLLWYFRHRPHNHYPLVTLVVVIVTALAVVFATVRLPAACLLSVSLSVVIVLIGL